MAVTHAVARSTTSVRRLACSDHAMIFHRSLRQFWWQARSMKRAAYGAVSGSQLRTPMAAVGPERASVAAEVAEAATLLSQGVDKDAAVGGRSTARPAGDLYELLLEADRGYAFPQPGVRSAYDARPSRRNLAGLAPGCTCQ